MIDETEIPDIGENTVEGALEFLAKTDLLAVQKRAYHSRLVELRKSVKSAEFLSQESGTVQAREASAYNSEAYREHLAKIEKAEVEAFVLNNKRHRAELVIAVWQTKSANARRANIT